MYMSMIYMTSNNTAYIRGYISKPLYGPAKDRSTILSYYMHVTFYLYHI